MAYNAASRLVARRSKTHKWVWLAATIGLLLAYVASATAAFWWILGFSIELLAYEAFSRIAITNKVALSRQQMANQMFRATKVKMLLIVVFLAATLSQAEGFSAWILFGYVAGRLFTFFGHMYLGNTK